MTRHVCYDASHKHPTVWHEPDGMTPIEAWKAHCVEYHYDPNAGEVRTRARTDHLPRSIQ